MLRELLASRPAPSIRSGPVAASAVAHVVLIAFLLMTTSGTGSHAHGWNHLAQETPPLVQVRYLLSLPTTGAVSRETSGRESQTMPARKDPTSERRGAGARLASLRASLDAVTHRLADIRPALDVADSAPAVDADYARWTAVADSEFKSRPAGLSDATPSLVPLVKNGIYTPDLVDEPVRPRPGNAKPRYPESLRAAGVEADVNVEFVVDTAGRVDEPSIRFASQIHELFMDAIRVSLRRARFFPARLAGGVVPQLVQQEFRFEIRQRP